jgi:hypothetical protein
MIRLFRGLFDDAALFPPGDAPMAAAVPAHAALRREYGALTGPFIVPAARLDDLFDALDGGTIAVSLIAAPGGLAAAIDRVHAEPGLGLAGVEVPPPADAGAAAEVCATLARVVPPEVPAAVELPRTAERDGVLDVLAGAGRRAKLRTGGVRPELFPPADELAATLAACLARGVAVKCTAGLHGAAAHVDPATGFAHHGFLNVLLAVDALADGGSAADAAGRLAQTSAPALADALRDWAPERAARARRSFTSFGTCSVADPVGDLSALGLLHDPDRIPA